jgi:hypothetical protein
LSKRASLATAGAGPEVLLQRDAELRAVEELLESARAGIGRLLLLEGHAGIGKSALLDAAVAQALASGSTVMRARASELESDFAFGVALQLFEPLLAGSDDEAHDRLLAGSAALAGPLLERPTSWIGDEADERSYAVIHGLFWLLSNLAESAPVMIAIDDAHWADRTSLRLLLYILQRVGAMNVAIVVARRLGEPGAPDDLLGQIAAHASSVPVRPRALTRDGARELVARKLPAADDAFADACWRMTEGNCFLLGELIRAVAAQGWEPTQANAARIGTLAPDAVLRAVAVRLMRLSDDAAGVARAVAVLGDDAEMRHVATLTGRDAVHVAAAADALAAGEILRPPDRGVLRFAHPLLASAVYADVGAGERAALHRRAAEILHDESVPAERVAAHLLPSAGSGEGWVVEVLCDAARHALLDGAPESAASYLRRALDEPPSAAARTGVLRRLGLSEASSASRRRWNRRPAPASARTCCSTSAARCRATATTPARSPPSTRRPRPPRPIRTSPCRPARSGWRSGCCCRAAARSCSRPGARRRLARSTRRRSAGGCCSRPSAWRWRSPAGGATRSSHWRGVR